MDEQTKQQPWWTRHQCYREMAQDGGRIIARDDRATIVHVPPCSPYNDEALSDSDFIMRAFNAAHAIHAQGYDPLKVMEAMPEILDALKQTPGTHALLARLR